MDGGNIVYRLWSIVLQTRIEYAIGCTKVILYAVAGSWVAFVAG
jgi:hypothetical protein